MKQQQMKQPNKDYIIQSLQNQLSNANMDIANRDAIITELYQEKQELQKQLDEQEVKEMNAE